MLHQSASIALKLQTIVLQGFLTSDLEEYHSPGWVAASAHAAARSADVQELDPMEAQLEEAIPQEAPALDTKGGARAGAGLERMKVLLRAAFEPEAAIPRAASLHSVSSTHCL